MEHLRELAKFISELDLASVPSDVVQTARRCVLDTVAAAMGAVNHTQLCNVQNAMEAIYGTGKGGTVWGRGTRLPYTIAAFLNGMAGHVVEMDDVHTRSKTHIGTVVVPAAWAAAEENNSTGKEFLEAVICGYEVTARIGIGFGVTSHRNLGWHSTSTAGVFGAAAACAKLMKLNEEQIVSALGLAGTQAFGTWAFLGDGASNKVLHPARAAFSGYDAALLARAGMTGPEHILSASDGGLYPAMSDEYNYDAVTRGLGSHWEITQMTIKPYPCCRSTHCAIDGALALRKAKGFVLSEIETILVETYLVGYKQCGLSEGSINPAKAIEAKFSIPYTVSCALLRGNVRLEDFEESSIQEDTVQQLLKRVHVKPCETFSKVYPDHWGCTVHLVKKDGSIMSSTVTDACGSVDNPVTEEQLTQKVESLLSFYESQRVEEVIKKIITVDSLPCMPSL